MPSKSGIEDLKRHEGFTPRVSRLKTQEGTRERVRTLGYGYNVDAATDPEEDLLISGVPEEDISKVLAGELAISKEQADNLFQVSVRRATDDAIRSIPNFTELDVKLQDVFINMSYQLGAKGLREFKKMRSALINGDYEGVAKEILNSKFARKQATNRAKELAGQVREYAASLPPEAPKISPAEQYRLQVKQQRAQQVAKALSRNQIVSGLARTISTMTAEQNIKEQQEGGNPSPKKDDSSTNARKEEDVD